MVEVEIELSKQRLPHLQFLASEIQIPSPVKSQISTQALLPAQEFYDFFYLRVKKSFPPEN